MSFEFFPPSTPQLQQKLWQALERLAPLAPRFVSVTYGAGGTTRERTHETVVAIEQTAWVCARRRISPAWAPAKPKSKPWRNATGRPASGMWWRCAAIRRKVRADLRRIPAVTACAADLVTGLKRVADFEISVAAHPEVHPDARSPQADLENLKRKQDAGAARGITQFFFDLQVFLRFRDTAVKAGVSMPLVPGILPVTNFQQVQKFSARCGASVPASLARHFDGLDQDPETRKLVAAHVAGELCRQLQAEGVHEFHFYTLNRAELTRAICHLLGIRAADAQPLTTTLLRRQPASR